MNKDRVKGKVKDAAGRVQRQVGEWTGDSEFQIKGAARQVEGKVQNTWGEAKDAVKKPAEGTKQRHADERGKVEERDKAEAADEEESAALRRRTG